MNNWPPEIKKQVYEKYPITKAERRGCQLEKAAFNHLRKSMAEKLMKEKREQEGAH